MRDEGVIFILLGGDWFQRPLAIAAHTSLRRASLRLAIRAPIRSSERPFRYGVVKSVTPSEQEGWALLVGWRKMAKMNSAAFQSLGHTAIRSQGSYSPGVCGVAT